MRTLAENACLCDFISTIIMLWLLLLLLLLMPYTSLWIWTVSVGASMMWTTISGTHHRITLTTSPALLAHAQMGMAPAAAILLKARRCRLHHTQMGSKALWIGKDEAAGIALLSGRPVDPWLARLLKSKAKTEATNSPTSIRMRATFHPAFTIHTIRTCLKQLANK
jgi:hypothetical protein